jgi:hypothetical protein
VPAALRTFDCDVSPARGGALFSSLPAYFPKTQRARVIMLLLVQNMEPNQDLYRDIFDDQHIGLTVWRLEDLDDPTSFTTVTINRAAVKATKMTLSIEQMIGKRVADMVPGLRASGILEQYADILKQGESKDVGEVYYPGDAVVPEATFYSQLHVLSKDTLLLEFTNITEKKKTEEKLKTTVGELTRANALMVDRELKMIELKKEIDRLSVALEKREGPAEAGPSPASAA